uniref:ATP synthase complex subunit 8 n=1 Tax=Therioaphis trifolii TaxID=935269 RepID=A0A6B9QJU7_9HEMI|nr:ATP synthase F0 subunit 8 [Therioaphis trifolii]
MPQMAPINWLILFILFFFTFIITSNMIYFMYLKNMKMKSNKKNLMKNYNKFI